MREPLETPVILILFKRPDTTKEVFGAIRRAKPKYLYIAADGPRNSADEEFCKLARSVVADIDWECEVTRDYSDTNLGVSKRPSSAVTKAFETYEEAIILEDDILPTPYFFEFCQDLLRYWKDEERIHHISGTNFIHRQTANHPYSYYFNHHAAGWGWATWKRAWDNFDIQLGGWPELRDGCFLRRKLHTDVAIQQWTEIFDLHYDNDDPWAWDYHWVYSLWKHNGLAISPRTNLVENIGFGGGATHTGGAFIKPDLPVDPKFREDIVHPPNAGLDEDLDRFLEKHLFRKSPGKIARGVAKLKRMLLPFSGKN